MPRESSGERFLSDLPSLLSYPSGSGNALLEGTLKLRYNTSTFARKRPTWRLPEGGRVRGIISAFRAEELAAAAGGVLDSVDGSLVFQSFKRVRLTKKLLVLWYTEFLQGQFRIIGIMTLWETDLLGSEGGLTGGCMRDLAREAGWIESELAQESSGGDKRHFLASRY